MNFSPCRIGLVLICGLLGFVSAYAGTQASAPPMLRINFNDGSPQQVFCLEAMPGTIQVLNDETFLEVEAFPECPPDDIVRIDSFLVDSDPTDAVAAGNNIQFDITENIDNCTIGGDTRTCLFFTWDTLVGFNVTNPSCFIQQDGTPIMEPGFIQNPGSNSPAEPALSPYVSDLAAPGLAWPIFDPSALTAGTTVTYRLNCTGGQSSSVNVTFVDGSTPVVLINSFNISQTSAAQGSAISYSYNLTFQNNPPNASCTLSSPGVINSQTITVSNGSGSNNTTLLATATTGVQTFTFSCRPDAVSAPTDSAVDTVNVTESGGGSGMGCPATIPGTNIVRDTRQTEFSQLYTDGTTWPGQWGVSGPDQRLGVLANRYKSLRFNTNTADPDELRGRFEWGKSGVGGLPRQATYTITSDCADFTPVNPACRRFSAANRIPWHLPSSNNPEPGSCLLQPNTQYYLNIIYDDATNGFGDTTCTLNECNHLINAGGGPPTFPNN